MGEVWLLNSYHQIVVVVYSVQKMKDPPSTLPSEQKNRTCLSFGTSLKSPSAKGCYWFMPSVCALRLAGLNESPWNPITGAVSHDQVTIAPVWKSFIQFVQVIENNWEQPPPSFMLEVIQAWHTTKDVSILPERWYLLMLSPMTDCQCQYESLNFDGNWEFISHSVIVMSLTVKQIWHVPAPCLYILEAVSLWRLVWLQFLVYFTFI